MARPLGLPRNLVAGHPTAATIATRETASALSASSTSASSAGPVGATTTHGTEAAPRDRRLHEPSRIATKCLFFSLFRDVAPANSHCATVTALGTDASSRTCTCFQSTGASVARELRCALRGLVRRSSSAGPSRWGRFDSSPPDHIVFGPGRERETTCHGAPGWSAHRPGGSDLFPPPTLASAARSPLARPSGAPASKRAPIPCQRLQTIVTHRTTPEDHMTTIETLRHAHAHDLEVAIETRDEIIYGCVIEVRPSEVLVAGRGSVEFRPLIQLAHVVRVRVLPEPPSAEAVRRLHIERRRAAERRALAAALEAGAR